MDRKALPHVHFCKPKGFYHFIDICPPETSISFYISLKEQSGFSLCHCSTRKKSQKVKIWHVLLCCAPPERCAKPIFQCVFHELTRPSGASIPKNKGCKTPEKQEKRCHLLLTAHVRKKKNKVQTRNLLTAALLGEVTLPKSSNNYCKFDFKANSRVYSRFWDEVPVWL